MKTIRPFTMNFDLTTGMTERLDKMTTRKLSNMRDMYYDDKALDQMIEKEDAVVYNFAELGLEEVGENLLFGTSITYPGKVGEEYFMTKGHFHTKIDLSEVYYCLNGEGYMLMETPEGDVEAALLKPGKSLFIPGRWAHRSINTGDTPLVTFFAFRADAGHDYGTIETKGFRKLIVEREGKPTIIDNPKWK